MAILELWAIIYTFRSDDENIKFEIFHAVSDNRFKWMDITNTCERVGYAPVDVAPR